MFCSYVLRLVCVIKKASKRLYFLVQLKRSRVPRHDMSIFYTACIRSILTYAAPVFFYALPKYLKDELVRVEKRAKLKFTSGVTRGGEFHTPNRPGAWAQACLPFKCLRVALACWLIIDQI